MLKIYPNRNKERKKEHTAHVDMNNNIYEYDHFTNIQ